ncbi:MAG TPA: type II secretion system protein GspM [bacterium]|nr:type II secretion system protein GspM [bacterium]HPS29857.1 type II secretion system protein GspM [bacterium]
MKEKILNFFTSLSERERIILSVMAAVMMIFVFVSTWFVMNSSVQERVDLISDQESMLQKMISMKNVYQRAQIQQKAMLENINSNSVSLSSDISTVKDSIGIEIATLKEINPKKKGDVSIERTEIGLRDVSLEDTLAFLYGIENKTRFVFVDSLNIKKRFNQQNYDVLVTVATLKKEVTSE